MPLSHANIVSGPGRLVALHLSAFAELSASDCKILAEAAQRRVRVLQPRQDIIREGDSPRFVNVILEGWVQRYKQLADGRRQILSFLVAGDLCDTHVFLLKEMDHSLSAVTEVRLAEFSQRELRELEEESPRIARALALCGLVAVAIQREWTTNIGQRTAYERIAHLFCEMFVRLRTTGRTEGGACEFPLTQAEIAEATGLTQVHVNRIIQEMRRDRLIELRNKRLIVHELERLMSVALFNPNYLHLGRGGQLDADD